MRSDTQEREDTRKVIAQCKYCGCDIHAGDSLYYGDTAYHYDDIWACENHWMEFLKIFKVGD